MYYRTIPFTSISNMDEQIDIDCIGEYDPKDKIEEQFKELVIKFGIVNTIERAWELYDLLGEERYIHIYNKGCFSSHLIDVLNRT